MGKAFRGKFYWNTVGKSSKLGMLICKHRRGLFMSVYVDDKKKRLGRNKNTDPMWKVLMKVVDLGEPTSFFDHVYLGCTQRECGNGQRYCRQLQKYVRIQNFRRSNKKIPGSGKPDANISTRSFDMEGHAKKCVERYCELADNTTQQLTRATSPPRGELRESPNDDHGVSVAF